MRGVITTRPASPAPAICAAHQSAHRSSPVMTSSSTQESTRVAEWSAEASLATEQRHDLVRAHARHVLAGGRTAEPPDRPLSPALSPCRPDDPEPPANLYDLGIIPGRPPVPGPQMRRDGHLAFAVQYHHSLPG